MMVTVSHSFSTSARMWLDSSTVRPRSFRARTSSVNIASIRGSRPEVGSSMLYRSTSRDRRSEEHTAELQSRGHIVCCLLLEGIQADDGITVLSDVLGA